jgi:hypothetical protein
MGIKTDGVIYGVIILFLRRKLIRFLLDISQLPSPDVLLALGIFMSGRT